MIKIPDALTMEDINVVMLDMAIGIEEQVTKNADGSYTIFLNTRYTYEHHVANIMHALRHIQSHDWERDSVQEIESEAHCDQMCDLYACFE